MRHTVLSVDACDCLLSQFCGAIATLNLNPALNLNKPESAKLQVVDSETGLAKNDSVRTSSGFFYELGEDEARPLVGRAASSSSQLYQRCEPCCPVSSNTLPGQHNHRAGTACRGRQTESLLSGPLHRVIPAQIIKGIERRLSYVTFLPMENGEGLQILRYEVRGGAVIGWAPSQQ